jgi:hypothetical protein
MTAWHRTGAVLIMLAVAGVAARAEDPALAPGRDPGGTAVAVLADGFDYTRADVAKVLARDGEGEAIAWDAVDGDHRPFARSGSGTETALAVAAKGGVRLVAVRVAAGDPVSLAKGVGFAAGTPARVVLVALADQERRGLDVMTAAAKRFEALLFAVSLPAPTAEDRKAGEMLANLVLIDSKDSKAAAAVAVADVLACSDRAGASAAELKRAVLDRLGAQSPAACKPGGDIQAD